MAYANQLRTTLHKLHSNVSRMAIIGLSCMACCAYATGFEPLPLSGVLLEEGSSAYILCNSSGKFDPDSHYSVPQKPTVNRSNTCAVFPQNEISAPLPGFSLVKHASRQAFMNNAWTGNTDKKIASVMDIVWRNAATSQCIYGTRVLLLSSADADYNVEQAKKQHFRVSDIARTGFAGQDIEIAYAMYASGAEPVYRVGRSFTAVQYHKRPGYQRQPLTEPAFRDAINGIDAPGQVVPTFSQQSASLDERWVNFTTLAGLPKRPASPMLYVKTSCSDALPAEQPGAIRLRQTTSPFIELSVPGFVPGHASPDITPQH